MIYRLSTRVRFFRKLHCLTLKHMSAWSNLQKKPSPTTANILTVRCRIHLGTPTPFEQQTACSHVSMLVYFVKILPHNRCVKRLTNSFLSWTATHEDTKGAGKAPHLYLYAVGKQCLCRCCVQRLQKTIEDQPVWELATKVAHDMSCRGAQKREENSLKYERVEDICMELM